MNPKEAASRYHPEPDPFPSGREPPVEAILFTPKIMAEKDLFFELLEAGTKTSLHEIFLTDPPAACSAPASSASLYPVPDLTFSELDGGMQIPLTQKVLSIRGGSESCFGSGGLGKNTAQFTRRRRKNTEQLRVLRQQFEKDGGEWTKETIGRLSKLTGLSQNQIYKWGWDQKQKHLHATVSNQNSDSTQRKSQRSRNADGSQKMGSKKQLG